MQRRGSIVDPKVIMALLEQAEHFDQDERFMAISDLTDEIEKMSLIDKKLQEPIRETLLKQFDGQQSKDVQATAVRWYVVLDRNL
jgi:hypothetical protein